MRYANIIYNDIVNAKGMSLSFYTQGCTHHCKGCFNKGTWDFKKGNMLNENKIKEIKNILKIHGNQYDNLCLLGGEPFDNINTSNFIINLFKNELQNKTIWCYTGYTFEELIQNSDKLKLLKEIDILIDGEFIEELKDVTLKFKGSSNQRILDIKESLRQNKAVLYEI